MGDSSRDDRRHAGLRSRCCLVLGVALACSPDSPTAPPDDPAMGAAPTGPTPNTGAARLVVPPPLDLGWGPNSSATDVNASGRVTGSRVSADGNSAEAVRWAPDGTIQSIRVGYWSGGLGINASGEVALNTAKLGIWRPWRWNPDNSLTRLEVGQGSWFYAHGINDAGIIVGESPALRWDRSGALTVLPWQGGAASAVNEAGQIAGWYERGLKLKPVMWSPSGTPTPLPIFGEDYGGFAVGLNNVGTVVGEAYTGTHEAAVQWKNGELSELEMPSGAAASRAGDVNDAGIIVGGIEWSNGWSYKALWASDGSYLGELPPLLGDIGAQATAIEGNYVAGSSTDSNGISRAVRWTLPHTQYLFRGFFPPVRNGGALNRVQAGASVPIKFVLGRDQGPDVLASNSPASVPIDCRSGRIINSTEEPTLSPNGLQHGAGQYIYVWKTKKTWAGGCRKFVLSLKDGTQHVALFQFK